MKQLSRNRNIIGCIRCIHLDFHNAEIIKFGACRCQWDIFAIFVLVNVVGNGFVRMSIDEDINTCRIGDNICGFPTACCSIDTEMTYSYNDIRTIFPGLINRILYCFIKCIFRKTVKIVSVLILEINRC